MWNKVDPWPSAVENGNKHSHLPWNQLSSVAGHPMMKMTVLDNALGWMKILDGCSFLGHVTLFLYSIVMSCIVHSYVYELRGASALKMKEVAYTLSMYEMGSDGILVLPNVRFIVSHVQIP
jgi:hypothetical protein